MKKIEAFIRHEALDAIRDRLAAMGLPSMSVVEVKGSGRQKGFTESYRGATTTIFLRPKLKLEMAVDDADVDRAVDTILELAHTGEPGDGKIFIINIEEAVRAGAAGYLTKDSAPNELVQALKKILGGGKFVSASMAELLVANLNEEAGRPQHELLSDREYQVMCLIAVGKSLKEIADDLCVGISTINTYRARILEKMQFKNNTELTHYALENRLVNRLVS